MPDRYVPRLGNYYLDIVEVRDGFENAIAVHEYPFSNRNELEHIGQKTRRIEVDCVFTKSPVFTEGWNIDYAVIPDYESHFIFLAFLESSRDDITFAHPKYGEITGKVEKYNVVADDTDELARVSFTFLQHVTTEETTFDRYIVPELAEEFRGATDTMTDDVTAEQTAATDSVKWTADTQTFINTLDAYKSTLTSPATSIMYQINYGTSVPGQLMESINGAVDRIVELYNTGRDSGPTFINNLIVGVRELKDTLSNASDKNRVHIMGASRIAYEAAVLLDEDDANRREIEDKEQARSFDAEGNYKKVDPLPETMTMDDLDAMLAQLKGFMNEAIQLGRDFRSLQTQAAYLQSYVNKIKFDRERINEEYVERQSMHLVCLNSNLSYQAAERLIRLNPTIKNPNFTYGNVKVLIEA